MNTIQVATFTHNGRPFYSFATPRHAGDAAFIAGRVCDYLTDTIGDGFNYQVAPVSYIRGGPAGDGDAIQAHGAALAAFKESGESENPPPTSAVSITRDEAAFIACALEVGSDDESHADSDYIAARELIEKVQQAADLGGSVVIQVRP